MINLVKERSRLGLPDEATNIGVCQSIKSEMIHRLELTISHLFEPTLDVRIYIPKIQHLFVQQLKMARRSKRSKIVPSLLCT